MIKKIDKSVSFKAKPIPTKIALEIKNELLHESLKTIGVYSHTQPDKDTLKSQKVLANWLKRKGKEVFSFVDCDNFKDINLRRKDIEQNYKATDKNLFLDFSSRERLSNKFSEAATGSTQSNIGIDHHIPTETKINGSFYIDTSAKACCAVIYRLFEAIGETLPKKDLKHLYTGILSDYSKSKLLEIQELKLIKFPALNENPEAKEVLEKIESKLSDKDKIQVYKDLDVLSNLTKKETAFRSKLFSEIKITTNGKLAYIIIPTEDKQWKSLGMDGMRTSTILRDVRMKTLNSRAKDEKTKNLKGVMVFYREKDNLNSKYNMSIHSIDNYAERLINYVKENINPSLTAGGHANRAGGDIDSIAPDKVKEFINNFLTAAENLDA